MFYNDYVWVKGKPRGKGVGSTYKIIQDPYGKRFSIERFQNDAFQDIVYDSNIFDFRTLISKVESSWQKIPKGESSLIRDHDDRTIAQEFYAFENDLCTECRIHYPEGPLVAIQRMFYKNEKLSAMVLFDILERPAGLKIYGEKGDFAFESWDMSDPVTQEKLRSLT